jgi:peptidoglycan hydrolase-like protein with peptidoglycan-binding domain
MSLLKKFRALIIVPCLILVFWTMTQEVKAQGVQEVDYTTQMELIQKLLAQVAELQQILASLQVSPSNVGQSQSSGTCLSLDNDLGYRASGSDVSALQDFLSTKGHLNSIPTGYYGLLTTDGVKNFQAQYQIEVTGYTGDKTRSKIKELTCSASTSDSTAPVTPISPNEISSLRPLVMAVGGNQEVDYYHFSLIGARLTEIVSISAKGDNRFSPQVTIESKSDTELKGKFFIGTGPLPAYVYLTAVDRYGQVATDVYGKPTPVQLYLNIE